MKQFLIDTLSRTIACVIGLLVAMFAWFDWLAFALLIVLLSSCAPSLNLICVSQVDDTANLVTFCRSR